MTVRILSFEAVRDFERWIEDDGFMEHVGIVVLDSGCCIEEKAREYCLCTKEYVKNCLLLLYNQYVTVPTRL